MQLAGELARASQAAALPIYAKLDVRNRAAAVAKALRLGLIG